MYAGQLVVGLVLFAAGTAPVRAAEQPQGDHGVIDISAAGRVV
jgi:hypothetical protein